MLAASTARPAGTPFGSGTAMAAGAANRSWCGCSTKTSRPSSSRRTRGHPPDRRIAVLHREGKAARLQRRAHPRPLGARHAAAQHQRLGAPADAAEARLDQHIARAGRHLLVAQLRLPGGHDPERPCLHAFLHRASYAGRPDRRKAARGRDVAGSATLHLLPLAIAPAAEDCGLLPAPPRTDAFGEHLGSRHWRKGAANEQQSHIGDPRPRSWRRRHCLLFAGGAAAQGLPPIQREFSNGSVLHASTARSTRASCPTTTAARPRATSSSTTTTPAPAPA